MDEEHPGPDVTSGNWYVLLTGLPRPDEEVELADGLTVRPLASTISVFDLAAAGAAGFREWAVLEPLGPAATCEIETAADATVLPGYDTLNRAWLATTLLVLRGYTAVTVPACSGYSWDTVAGCMSRGDPADGRGKLPAFRGNLLDYHLRLITTTVGRTDPPGSEDARWIRESFDTFNTLASESDSFRFALEALVDWRYARDARSALSRIWAGIEAIFGISSELVYRISTIGAGLTESRGQARRARFKEIKKLYNARSRAVHGDDISPSKLAEAIDGSFKLLSELLVVSINRGHALGTEDFDAALFD